MATRSADPDARVANEIRQLIIRIARDNPRWGYTRFVGALHNLSRTVSRSTVQRILAEEGALPAPEWDKQARWDTSLRSRWEAIAAADFFTVEVFSLVGLVRYHVAGVVHEPGGRWMMQSGRNLLDEIDGFLAPKRFRILDRDPVFTTAFRRLFKDAGVDVVRLPARSPNLNAHAERFVRSIRQECLDHIVPLGVAHLPARSPRVPRALPPRTQPSGPRQPAHPAARRACE